MKFRITADDLGLTKGVNYGIYDAVKYGVVNSVSLLMNTKYTEHALTLIKDLDVHVGVHLNIAIGSPLIANSVLSEYGFLKPEHNYFDEIEAIEKEYSAQIEKALDYGLKVSHLSTYDDLQYKVEVISELLMTLGKKYNIPVRGEIPFTDMFHGRMANMDTLYQLALQNVDSLEIKTMPGYLDGHLVNVSEYREMRIQNSSHTSMR